MAEKDELLTPGQAAALLGVKPATIRQYVARRILKPAERTAGSGKGKGGHARFSRASIEALRSRRFGATPPVPPVLARPAAGVPKMIDLGETKLRDKDGVERDAKLFALMLE